MAFATASAAHEPMAEMNTTPLIDVLLVLLVMFVISVPMATHSLEVPLPTEGPGAPSPIKNKVILTADGAILWNGVPVSQGRLASLLDQTLRMPVEPELQFEPAANAGYELTANVLDVIDESGVTRFGFVGNERYRAFPAP